ncbi:MAG: hypothetical protein OQL10_14135 [Sedimenticola sp.]|nr:hypothetical protein [Sedimenticola sp.]
MEKQSAMIPLTGFSSQRLNYKGEHQSPEPRDDQNFHNKKVLE